ncbi:MAG: TlpA family protein disulfide reductase, partial [Planctomycetota bacterium]
VVKQAAKPQQKARPDDRIGKPAPKYTFQTMDGKTVTNADLANHAATILNIVAPNCGFCKKQAPRTEKLRQQYEAKGVRFVNVVQTMRKKYTPEDAAKIFADAGSKLEMAYDGDNKVSTAFGGGGFPTMIVLGKSGKVEAVNVGNIGDLEVKVTGQLDALIAGKPIPQKYLAAKSRSRKRPAEDMLGKPSPQFSIKTLEGKPVGNAEFPKYKATVLNFVAPNCGYCKRQVPDVEAIRAEYEAKGVRFVNVVQKMRKDYTTEDALKVFTDVGSKLEFATDFTNAVGGKFKATSYPTMMVVDSTGKVKHVNIGAKKDLNTLLKGQLDGMMK